MQIDGLQTADVAAIGSAPLSSMSTAGIAALRSEAIAALATDQLRALNTAQIQAIEVGDLLEVSMVDGHIELRPLPADPIAAFCGSLQGGTSLAERLTEEHHQEVERDAQR